MASLNKYGISPEGEDEDELEALRQAALKSFKPKAKTVNNYKQNVFGQHSTFGAAQTTRNHKRGFRNNIGRIGRNGINQRARSNPNLISIQVIDSNDSKESISDETSITEAPKLILPQDRYHKTQGVSDTVKEKENSSNKFDRYDHHDSDESESDSDELNVVKPGKRERKNSLDDLMNDIDNILEGKNEYTSNKSSENSDKSNDEVQKDASDTLLIEDPELNIELSPVPEKSFSPQDIQKPKKYSRSRSRSPFIEKTRNSKPRSLKSRSKSPVVQRSRSPLIRSRSRSRSPIRKPRYSPPPSSYTRSISPLAINTEVLNTITMAPLSPRSAAFVLKNRQILAQRMSPRRSRSPRTRNNSLSPKRRRTRSRSPRFTPIRKSLSPRRRSNSPIFSPKRRSISPRNYSRRSPNFNRLKQPVHKRLGNKVNNYKKPEQLAMTKRKRSSRSISLSLSPSPDRSYHKRPLNETTGQVNDSRRNPDKPEPRTIKDPVLEARKKKFESPVQLGKNNGIIKLKVTSNNVVEQSQSSPSKETTEETNEPEELINEEESEDELEISTTIADIWSDEESDNENEGRFKSNTNTNRTVSTISLRKLLQPSLPTEPLLPLNQKQTKRSVYNRDRSLKKLKTHRTSTTISKNSSNRETGISRDRDRNSNKSKNKPEIRDKPEKIDKQLVVQKNKKEDDRVVSKIVLKTNENRPTNSNWKATNNSEINDKDDDPEIIIETEDDEVPTKDNDGDLRAELSRRRAERLQKAGSLGAAVPTRLLKNALQEVVPKRPGSKKSIVSKGNANLADRKVLILKRLSSNPATHFELANKGSNNEGGKLPIHMRLGQSAIVNNDIYEDVDDGIRERRSKKARSSKRKRQAVQCADIFQISKALNARSAPFSTSFSFYI